MVLSSSPSSSDSSHGSPVDRTTTARARLLQRLGARRGGDETGGSGTATAAASAPNPLPSASAAGDRLAVTTAADPSGMSPIAHGPGGLSFFPGGLEHSVAHRVLRSPPSPPPVLQFCRRMGIAMSPADALSREARALPELGRGGAQEGHDGLCRAVVATFVRRPRQATPCCWESKGGVVPSSTGGNGRMGP